MKNGHKPCRRVPMTQEMIELLKKQRERFRQKFGRDPRPDDPVIWDESAGEPTPASVEDIHQTILSAMIKTGAAPEFIYAFEKTGRLVTESNMYLLSDEDIKEWTDAVEEFRRLN
jgi:hypothetical protein